MSEFTLDILGVMGSILLVDLILSGDNALVIGAIAASLQKPQRWLAIAIGGGGALILRLIFAILATLLLQLPLLQALGGLLLLLIAIRLLATRKEKSSTANTASTQARPATEGKCELPAAKGGKPVEKLPTTSLLSAILTILVADVTMSLDNVLAVGGLARGNIAVSSMGSLLSIVILMFGSALVAELIGKLPWLLDGTALVLAWTGANMILNDLRLSPLLGRYPWTQLVIPSAAFAIVLFADVLLRMREEQSLETKRAG
ncbi:MAG TPA: YjbE family putative metal transport protein [Ktedonobacteraceae bacterium]|nr:YjbE family putative metal transport protein [Ktedonobacteraceae bacterium]